MSESLADHSPEDMQATADVEPLIGAEIRGEADQRTWLTRYGRGLLFFGLFILICALAGVLCAKIWQLSSPLPSVTVSSDSSVSVTDQALSEFFVADAQFMIIGTCGGVVLGALAWYWFRSWGWAVTLLAIFGAILASFLMWRVGTYLGPHDFAGRLFNAAPNASVPIDLMLRSATAWLLWPFGATIPILLYSALGRDEAKHDADEADSLAEAKRPPLAKSSAGGHRVIRFPAFGRH